MQSSKTNPVEHGEIRLVTLTAKVANKFVKTYHYSHKVVNNSSLHLGAVYKGGLHGVLSFGPPLDKSKVIGLVDGTPWNGMLELNRMAFDDVIPANGESMAIGAAMRLIKRNAPHVKWVVSFADACMCGDGTIYRASNFVLTDIRPNRNTARLPDGSEIHKMTLESSPSKPRKELGGKTYFDVTGGRYDFAAYCHEAGAEILDGFQLRYIYFIDKRWRKRLIVPAIPFSRIQEMGAGMYLGEKR